MKDKPNYYAIIPAIVRYDNDLKPNEKLLYGEITALTNKTGACYMVLIKLQFLNGSKI